MAKIKKQYQKNFTTIDNTVLKDDRLSWKAKGLFAYLWSKPDNWDYKVTEVAKHSADGESSTSTGVKELEKYGYLKREQQNDKGCFGGSVWVLTEEPISENHQSVKNDAEKPIGENPITENPAPEKPSSENRPLLNTDNTNKRITNKRVTKSSGSSEGAPTREDVFNQWQNDWGFPNSVAQQDLNEWLGQFGPEVVSYVIKYALSKNVTSRGADRFLAKVFETYGRKNITTVEQAKAANEQHDHRVEREAKSWGRKNKYGHQHIEEPLPDWATKPEPKKQISEAEWDKLAYDKE